MAILLTAVLAAALTLPGAASALPRHVARGAANAGNCTATPCGSFSYAYRLALPGDVIKVAAGTYGDQSIPTLPARISSAPVTFEPADGASVHLGGFNVHGGGGVAVRNIDTGSLDITDAQNVTVVNGHGTTIWLNNVRNVTIRGGSYGNKADKQPVMVGAYPESHNVTFDGVEFHDAIATQADVHTECLMANNVQGLTIRNSLFRNCAYFGVLLSSCCGGQLQPRDVLFESNVFEHTYQPSGEEAPCAMMIGPVAIRNLKFRNNTFETPACFTNTTHVDTTFVGNLGASGCADGVRYSDNVWERSTCSGTDHRASGLMGDFVNPRAHDWHLKPHAAAINKASRTDFPALDRDGHVRAGVADAGAYEYGTGPPKSGGGGNSGGSVRLIRGVRLSHKRICRHRSHKCRVTMARVKVRSSSPGRVVVQVRRAAGRHKLVRTIRKPLPGLARTVRIRGPRYGPGRYRVTVTVIAGGRKQKSRVLRLRIV